MNITPIHRNNADDLRAQQIEDARRMAESEGFATQRRTLSARPGYAGKKPSGPRAASSGSPKGHEAFLKALETSGADVSIEKCDGSVVEGKVIHSDKYTISIRETLAAERTRDRVIFKHDISEFSAITPRPVPTDSKTEEGHAV